MIVLVSVAGEVSLLEPDDFERFGVRIESDQARAAPAGLRIDGTHAWVSIEQLRRQAPAHDPDWLAKLDRMLDFARSKGWLDEAGGAVRGHIAK